MMMHIGLFPFAVAWNLSTNRTTLQNSRRIRALIKEPTTKASKTKPPTKGKKSLVPWVAETTSELLVDDNQLVKQAQPIAKPDPRDYQVALAQAKAGFEQAKAQLAQSQAQMIQADAQLKQAQAQAAKARRSVGAVEPDDLIAKAEKASKASERDASTSSNIGVSLSSSSRALS